MSRFLFVFPPLVGHVNPALGVAHELEARGHEVAWVAHQSVVGTLIGPEATIYPAGDEFLFQVLPHLTERDQLKGLSALKFLWEKFLVPLAAVMVPHVRAAVDEFDPDVVVSDQQTFAGGIVADERGLPWAVSACGTAELADPASLMPKVALWFQERLEALFAELDRPDLAARHFDPRYSPHLVLQYSTRELVGDAGRDRPSLLFVGPVLPNWAEPVPFPWDWLDRHDTNIFVSLGTLSGDVGERFLGRVLEAVEGKPYGVVMVAPDGLFPDPPENVLIRPFVPQLQLVPRVQAVLTHAGHNTTVGTLAEGVPLVCAPIRDDQPIIAKQVADSGAGVRINFVRARPPDIARAIDDVIHDPSYREAAARIAKSFAEAGGAAAAADHLERLAPTPAASA